MGSTSAVSADALASLGLVVGGLSGSYAVRLLALLCRSPLVHAGSLPPLSWFSIIRTGELPLLACDHRRWVWQPTSIFRVSLKEATPARWMANEEGEVYRSMARVLRWRALPNGAMLYIEAFRVRNFRRLRQVGIDLDPETTVFVGANNSGKTSAAQVFRLFLGEGKVDQKVYAPKPGELEVATAEKPTAL